MRAQLRRLSSRALPKNLGMGLLLLALLLALAVSSASVARAATTLTVTTTADESDAGSCGTISANPGADGVWSLREAICATNNVPGADTINITAAGTISLGSNLPAVLDAVTISGPGKTSLFLDGNSLYRVLNVNCSSPGCSVNISGLTIQKGSATAGPAIYAGGSNVTLSHVIVKYNTLATDGSGAAMECFGVGSSMTLNDVNVSYNSTTATYGYAGGLYGALGCPLFLNNVAFDHNTSSNGAGGMSISRAATLDQVSFTNNTGKDGGALSSSGTVTVTNSTFTNNKSTVTDRFGGAVSFPNDSLKGSIDRSTFSGNTADLGAAMLIGTGAANLAVTNTTFENNIAKANGGAILNYGSATITNVTFSGNQVTDLVAGYGGAVDNHAGEMTLTNATFDLNSAKSGSAIYNGTGGKMTLVNNTVTRNMNGPAIRTYSGITLTNTIVSDHTAGNCDLKTDGVITDGGGNLNFASHGLDCPGISADPMLYFLGYNGGTVPTRLLMTGSGAINAGNATTCAAAVGAPTFGAGGVDARGLPRRAGFCDIGAFEAQPANLSIVSGSSPQTARVNTAFAHSLGVNVTDAYTNTLGGVTVNYTAPASGASAVLSGTTATSNASGNASVMATANGKFGAPYNVTATVSGLTPINFVLTNSAAPQFLPLLRR